MTQEMTVKCSIGGCRAEARYSIRPMRLARWVDVCGTHDNMYAHQNLIALGLTAAEATRWLSAFLHDPDGAPRLP